MSDIFTEAPKDIDCLYTDNLVCPYCGYEDHDSWEYAAAGQATCAALRDGSI